MIVCALKAFFAWIVLTVVGNNLVGLILRGLLWSPPIVDAPTDRVAEILNHETKRLRSANIVMTVVPLLLTALLLFSAYHYWNIGLAVSVATSRVPDQIWQIRTGLKRTRHDKPEWWIQRVGDILFWVSLPLIWYSLCKWGPS
jgi:hypothetical protein